MPLHVSRTRAHHQEVKIALHSLWYHTETRKLSKITNFSRRLRPATPIPPQTSHTKTPTHIKTGTHNQCGDTIEKSQASDDGCINVRNMLSIEEVK